MYLRLVPACPDFSGHLLRERIQVGVLPAKKMNILDLASGDAQILKLLLQNHGPTKCPSSGCQDFSSNYAKKICYTAVDFEFPTGYRQSLKDLLSQFADCFELILNHFI